MNRILIAALIIGLIYILYKTYQQKHIAPNLEQLIASGAIILDVRTTKEYNEGHIENSLNISLGNIRERYIELDTAKTYITCCSLGLRSIKVMNFLKERGFKKVYNGGVWQDLESIINKVN